MKLISEIKIALVGNPNSGKSSLFNHLTGLNQKIGNFPGVTVDKKIGSMKINEGPVCSIIDLPGTYSIYPKSEEEAVVMEVLGNKENPNHPDLVVVIADATNLKRNLLLFSQVHDLGMPVILALNMMDLVNKKGKTIDVKKLKDELKVPLISMNARNGDGIDELKQEIKTFEQKKVDLFFKPEEHIKEVFGDNTSLSATSVNTYLQLQEALNNKNGAFAGLDKEKIRRTETLARYHFLDGVLEGSIAALGNEPTQITARLDKVLTHKVWGYTLFVGVLFLIFQSVFKWAEMPMDFIDHVFSVTAVKVSGWLPQGPLNGLISEGIIPGLAGIVIFIPQIALLFAFISILEETGYMSRVVFLMDKLMRKFGLNGKSVVPLISGVACAVPAIMAARTIGSKRDRIITIMVTPLMSCSARLPVYTILIALVIPATSVLGVFNLQGIILFGLYTLGFVVALVVAVVIKLMVKTEEPSYLVMEMPSYKLPRWQNVVFTIYEKTKTFVFEAGKIILAISIILWITASYGPADDMKVAEENATQLAAQQGMNETETENLIAAYKLEHSFAGIFGKAIEPAIKPLGYDWKIGIALISSFAAREVFVGTMATIYSIGGTDDELTVRTRMAKEVNSETGGPRFTLAVGVSLMLFYAFAMQCMSTLAIVYRETRGWKWPFIQLAYMTGVAYLSALLAYQLLS
ncbi:MAG: ferrous iron transport protein B [Cyclobacteriaceae bacterium]|nr:ferrous iron transport protein B [Cyclobacteriaceae bacterium]